MNNAIKIALVVVLLGAAAFFVFRFVNQPAPGDAVMEQETVWRCSNAECKNVYRVKRSERAKLQADTGSSIPPCPKCSRLGAEVYECPFCKGLFDPVGHGSFPDNCPNCGKNLAGDASKDKPDPKPAPKTPGHG